MRIQSPTDQSTSGLSVCKQFIFRFRCREPFWWLTTRVWFDPIIHAIVLLNLIPVIWEVIIEMQPGGSKNQELSNKFLYTNIAFTSIYLLEFILKLIGHGWKTYFRSKWNYLDVLVLIVSIIDVAFGLSLIFMQSANQHEKTRIAVVKSVVLAFRIMRITRSLRLLKANSSLSNILPS